MKWYDIKNKADKSEIWIYEMIGQNFWTGDGVTAKTFQKDLSEIKSSQIDLHINSPGGDVFDGNTIYNLLKQHPATVTTYIDGLAASIASVIAMAGDKIYMAENGLFMMHNPWGLAMGQASDMRKMADTLDKVRDSMTTIYNLLKQHPATVTTYIDGLAASIASVIAMAGDKIYMAENGLFMMHNPWGLAMGQASDMRKMADTLDKVRDSMTTIYTKKSGKTESDINALLMDETWLSADEALEAGFIDEITGKMDMAACSKFGPVMAKLGFKKIPDAINPNPMPSAKEAEKALRDVGFSIKQAKTILVKGIADADDLRDVDHNQDAPPAPPTLRDVEPKRPITNDRTAALLIKADMASQSKSITEG